MKKNLIIVILIVGIISMSTVIIKANNLSIGSFGVESADLIQKGGLEEQTTRINIPTYPINNVEPITLQDYYLEDNYSKIASELYTPDTQIYTNGEIEFSIINNDGKDFLGYIFNTSDAIKQYNKLESNEVQKNKIDPEKFSEEDLSIKVDKYDSKKEFEKALSEIFATSMTIEDLVDYE